MLLRSKILLIILLFLTSCSHYRWVFEHEDEVRDMIGRGDRQRVSTSTEIHLDTIEKAISNPILLNELFKCDSNKKVLLRKNDSLKENGRTVVERVITKTKTQTDTIVRYEREEVPRIVTQKYVPWYFWALFIVTSLILLFLGAKFL